SSVAIELFCLRKGGVAMLFGYKPALTTALFMKQIPNVLTLVNMLSGLTVLYLNISMAGQDYSVLSCFLILIAAGLDAFDGTIARLLDTESDFGKQLDSFADLISFGI